jgi:hypothetical protein
MSDVLRALVLALVALALLLPDRVEDSADAVIVRAVAAPPDDRALDSLAAAAAHRPLLAALPDAPALTVSAPYPLVVGRAAALSFAVRATPGAEQRILLRDADAHAIDSTAVRLDTRGTGSAAFRVRPDREGWYEWRIDAAGQQQSAGAWAVDAAPPRVLIVAGAAGPESGYIAAALEESGAVVELRQPLGHGLAAGGAAITLPASATGLEPWDVVIVLPGTTLDAARRAALASFVESGGGMLLAARDELLYTFGLVTGAQPPARALSADSIEWHLPAELAGLAPGRLSGVVEPLAGPVGAFSGGALRGAGAGEAAPLVLRWSGSGRVAGVALRETWRWRIEGGDLAGHREFWRSLVDWLAPVPTPYAADARGGVVPVGLPTLLELVASAGVPDLHRPDGAVEPIAVQSAADRSLARVAFVAADTGVHVLRTQAGAVIAAVRATAAAAHEPAARLALLAAASGGRAVPRDQVADSVAARAATSPVRAGPWRAAVFVLLLALAFADWVLRRVRGQA